MRELLNYNFNIEDINDLNFSSLYEKRRRDSIFASVFEVNGKIYLLRDHLGIVPLFYKIIKNKISFSTNISDLLDKKNIVFSKPGLEITLAFKTPKLFSPFKDIKVVPPGTCLSFDKKTNKVTQVYYYKFNIKKNKSRKNKLISDFDNLLDIAIKRQIKEKTVGIYLSGGTDSGLLGHYLKKHGVSLNSYTCAPWGKNSSEIKFAKLNIKNLKIKNSVFTYLEPDDYENLIEDILSVYKYPHATETSIGITKMWKETNLSKEKQIFFGQNSDTMFCSMLTQDYAYWINFFQFKFFRFILPNKINQKLYLISSDLYENYVYVSSGGMTKIIPEYISRHLSSKNSTYQNLIILGILMCHSARDSEEYACPAINRGILVSNPYYDIDVVEFCLSLPLRSRLGIKEHFIKLGNDKKLIREVGVKYVPKEIVYRVKGFVVDFNRSNNTKKIANNLPSIYRGIHCKTLGCKLYVKIFKKWLED